MRRAAAPSRAASRAVLQRNAMAWNTHSWRHNFNNPTWPTEWRPVMPMGGQQQEPAEELNIFHFRTGTDATMDEHTPEIQHDMLVTEKRANQTGNHEPRNHQIRVPTAPGEPVRG